MKKELTGRTYVRPKVKKSIVIGRPLLQTVSGNAGVIGSGGSMGDAKNTILLRKKTEKITVISTQLGISGRISNVIL